MLVALVWGMLGICEAWAIDSHFDCELEEFLLESVRKITQFPLILKTNP